MNDKVRGLVLRIQDYKDNDLMLHVISEDKGILSLVAKSAKKMTAKQHFFEGCHYEFMIDYKDNKSIYSLHSSKLIKTYYDMNNTKLFSYKNILFDTILKSRELYEEDMYINILFVLDNINEENKYLLGSLFMSYMCKLHGINPNVDECVVCKSKKVVSISSKQGGFLCIDHINGETIYDIDTLRRFRLISKAGFKDYDVIKDTSYSFDDFKLIFEFFEINSSLSFKSFEFYRRVI